MAIIHLLHGLPGSGKTTFARRLVRERGAVLLSHDAWMVRLYGRNPPTERFVDLHGRVSMLIWRIAEEFLRRGIEVVLDHGFWTRRSRDEARERAMRLGATPLFYRMECGDDLARERVLARTESAAPDALVINAAAFEEFRKRFEPLAEDEVHETVVMET